MRTSSRHWTSRTWTRPTWSGPVWNRRGAPSGPPGPVRPSRPGGPVADPAGPGTVDLLVLGLFFLSGASALIYEVVWSRLLGFIFGGTAFAIATVLAAYMAGLALGSWYFGRRIDRTGRPLGLYALLEGGIALWAILLPTLLGGLNLLYAGIYRSLNPDPYILSLVRFVFSFLALLFPTTLMGGTLPVLAKLLERGGSRIGLKTGLLYGINTIGAVTGTAVAGFLLIPRFGMNLSTWIAIGFNLAVTALAFLIQSRLGPALRTGAERGDDVLRTPAPPLTPLKRGALVVYALSGFAAMAYQLAWTKVLSGVLGTTTYAFSAMLTTFLLGLSLGALLMARLADRIEASKLLAVSQIAIGFFGLAALPLFGNLPYIFIHFFRTWGPEWGPQTAVKFLLCAATMLLPTLLMGGTFPLVARIYADDTRRMGRQVGELYAANTVGAIIGSFMAGFILIPLLGRQGTILTAAGINALSGIGLYLLLRNQIHGAARWAAAAAVAALIPVAVIGARPWDKEVLASGAYVYAETYSRVKDLKAVLHDQTRLFFEEETEAIVAVYRTESVMSLRTNGKVEASSSGDMLTQKMISHLPLLYHPQAEKICMIGLASGISLGSALVFPEVRSADCIEMLASMREASHHFRSQNYDCLADPRTRLIINDGRNHLLLTDQNYDVLISQPSNPWIAGISTLFTREFFALGRSRLRAGGIFCQWVQMYQMSRDDFSSVLRTFREAFPHVVIWTGVPGDVILLGSETPLTLDAARFLDDLRQPAVRADLDRVEIADPWGFLQGYIGRERALDALQTPDSPIITDDNLRLEFSMPRNLYASDVPMMDVTLLGPVREPATTTLDLTSLPPDSADAIRSRLDRYFAGRTQGLPGIAHSMAKSEDEAVRILEPALELAPTDPLIRYYLAQSRNEVGIKLMQGGQESQAIQEFRRVAEIGSRSEKALALNNLGLHAFNQGLIDSARVLWESAVGLEPESPTIRYNLAILYEGQGQTEAARREYRRIVEVDPRQAGALNNLAWSLAGSRETAGEAVGFAERAVRLNPTPGNHDTWGYALYQAGRTREAERPLRTALSGDPNNVETGFHLGLVLAATGRAAEARPLLEKAAGQGGNPDLARRAREALTGLGS